MEREERVAIYKQRVVDAENEIRWCRAHGHHTVGAEFSLKRDKELIEQELYWEAEEKKREQAAIGPCKCGKRIEAKCFYNNCEFEG